MNKTNNFYPGTLQQNQAQYEPIRLARSCGGQSVLLQHVDWDLENHMAAGYALLANLH
ncbi:hypothetical protein AAG906_034440 [Vitis piasezkii]|uniref:Uncharacterized protein n=1 Tax=Vitis vinifera TaxID=29760 RepID=A0A438GBP3_VITVI|nr:hypothetical protein CK203_062642 [Vitis vinifera]